MRQKFGLALTAAVALCSLGLLQPAAAQTIGLSNSYAPTAVSPDPDIAGRIAGTFSWSGTMKLTVSGTIGRANLEFPCQRDPGTVDVFRNITVKTEATSTTGPVYSAEFDSKWCTRFNGSSPTWVATDLQLSSDFTTLTVASNGQVKNRTCGGLSPAGDAPTADEVLTNQVANCYLKKNSARLSWTSSGTCQLKNYGNCTSFDGMRGAALAYVIRYAQTNNLTGVVISGGTETGHQTVGSRPWSSCGTHAGGYKIDLATGPGNIPTGYPAVSGAPNAYHQTNTTPTTSDDVVWYDERATAAPHWDVYVPHSSCQGLSDL